MLRNVQPVVPAAVQNQPRHQTVTGLTRAAVISGKVVAPLLVAKQRVERIHVHVVTAGHHIRVRRRKVSDTAVTLSVQGRRRTNNQNL